MNQVSSANVNTSEITLERLERLMRDLPKPLFNKAVVAPDVYLKIGKLVRSAPGFHFFGVPLFVNRELPPGGWQLWLDDVLYKTNCGDEEAPRDEQG